MGEKTDRVERTVREWISSGELAGGAKLPSERTLSADLGVGRTTVRLVLAKLAAEGLVVAQHGSGYYVSTSNPEGHVTVKAPHGELEPWRIHGERLVYDNEWVKLALVDVEPPGVERFEHHVVRLQHVAITAVVDDQDRVLMLWRYRFVPGRFGWELPGGIVDAGEEPAAAAAREVEEETGWRPGSIEHVVTYQPMVGMVDSPHEIFVARGATLVGEPTDAEEAGRIEWIPLAEVPGLIARDELLGSGTLVALLHLLASRSQRPTGAR
ncbi:GntR family transcriptional regulator [Kitasatospora sp. DSM 101779]|uniref:GntR family transcriptional regulator n=1 Tax=Kitasatospora sp. DSM 101779 TaxID=2853165 RepID=UPI0021D8A37C|nr:GntR family transcriptional regulator [Kitasatospora sp. DSM 101779]MCU7822637.1 GntR family transcriptional regulator [Kitasatospora sp. DSM 101779]